MSERSDPVLEAALADLATVVRFPPTPSLAAAIGSHLGARPGRVGWPWTRSFRRSLVLAVAGVAVLAGAAGAIGIGIGAIQIRFADGTPLPTPHASILNRGFGVETTLADAQATVPFAIRLPSDSELGAPDAVFLAGVPRGGTLTLVWGDLVVTQFSADIGPDTFEKMITEGTRVESVLVNGRPGWWVEGGTHAFFYRDADGQFVDTTLRLVTSALIWDEDGLALRVEGAPDLEAALRVAASLE